MTKDSTKIHYPVHYHVTKKSVISNTISEIMMDHDASRIRYAEIVQKVKDVTEATVNYFTYYVTYFTNMDIVRWRPCDEDCLVDEEKKE